MVLQKEELIFKKKLIKFKQKSNRRPKGCVNLLRVLWAARTKTSMNEKNNTYLSGTWGKYLFIEATDAMYYKRQKAINIM